MRTILEYDQFLNEETDYRQNLLNVARSALSQMLSGTPSSIGTGADGSKSKDSRIRSLSDFSGAAGVVSDLDFTYLNLNDPKGFQAYEKICQTFIDKRPPNLLKITGKMLADAAKRTYNDTIVPRVGAKGRYIPPELVCAQLALEGGIGNSNPKSRPIKTKNPFNVGNVDGKGESANRYHDNVQDGIDAYYSLIARRYLVPPRKPSDLLKKFTNVDGNAYATSTGEYEKLLSKITKGVNAMAKPILASLGVKPSNMA